jgi:predicted RNase H-like nuclease (RuvC/YqgF family)
MTSTLLPALVVLVGTLAGAAVTWVVATRKSSGKIVTSEATVLWEASESIRHDLTAQVATLTSEVVALRTEIKELRLELSALRKRLES